MQLCKAVPGNPVQHHTVLYLVQCAVCSVQYPVSSVQLERERGREHVEPDGAAATDQPLAEPGHSRFHTAHSTLATLGYTLDTAHRTLYTMALINPYSYSLSVTLQTHVLLFFKNTIFSACYTCPFI